MTRTIAERAHRLIKAATGDKYGDGMIVTDISHAYAEPGYSGEFIVFGDWNDVGRTGTKADTLPSRLASALERIGVSIEWCDEWTICEECGCAFRTSGDSYGWTMYGSWGEYGIICADCLKRDPNAYLDEYVNNSDKAVTWLTSAELSAAGWTQWEASNPHSYENGWHPGQDDDPASILASIASAVVNDSSLRNDDGSIPQVDVVFLIDSVGQFDCRFSAWTRDDIDA